MHCRAALMADQAALRRWETDSPLLIMGSHQWHTPDKNGNIYAGGARQKQIMQSASHRYMKSSACIWLHVLRWNHLSGIA